MMCLLAGSSSVMIVMCLLAGSSSVMIVMCLLAGSSRCDDSDVSTCWI